MGQRIVVENVVLSINRGKIMKFCPRCGSKEITWVLPQNWSKYECKTCGLITAFIVEDGSMAQEIQKEYIKKQKEIQGKNGE